MSSGDKQSSSGNHFNGFDLGAIRDILEQDTNTYLKGVKNTDVDWFLRDSNISAAPPMTIEREEDKDDNKDKSIDATNIGSNSPLFCVSSHLTTNISNTNDKNANKTKPSVAPIQEEIASPSKSPTHSALQHSQAYSSPIVRRGSSISSVNSNGSSSGGGFFSRIKDKLSRKNTVEEPHPPIQSAPIQKPIFKENFDLKLKKIASNNIEGHTQKEHGIQEVHNSESELPSSSFRLTRTMSTPSYTNQSSDPRLDEYIKFYQQKCLRRNSSSRKSSVSSVAKYYEDKLSSANSKDTPLPSALVNGYDNANYSKNIATSYPDPQSSASKFSFLRRRSINTPNPVEKNRRSSESMSSISSSVPNSSSPPSSDTLPEFKGLKPLKRVAFHSSTFLIDPPQQIPSRNPRKGNVEVLPNGVLRINPLTEADKVAIEKSQMGQGGGIVVGGTGTLGFIKPRGDGKNEIKDEEKEVDDKNNENNEYDEEDTAIDKRAKLIEIDKPMIAHQKHSYSVPIQKMALDLMYTRCCHLREILPIPAILKQIPKGSMAPLPMLQLRNANPTMVEIQTFADFIRIAPIICISLDGVNLSIEQFKILLSAMSAKKQLQKLSFRNTPISHEGWSLFCWFLSRNTVLNKLDITQCPSLSVNVLRKKKKKPSNSNDSKKEEEIKRMVCNKDNRSDMDWSLFTATLIARGGIEELILTGCGINDLDIFEKFIKFAVSIRTNKLGLAYNHLSVKQVKIVVDHWLFNDFVRGLDLGYNDFSSLQFLNAILDITKDNRFEKKILNSSLSFLSLNATNLRFSDTFKEVFESVLMKYPSLRYLDLSNNPRLFGTLTTNTLKSISDDSVSSIDLEISSTESLNLSSSGSSKDNSLNESSIISYFTSKFPLFPKLIRLHLENNNLSTSSLLSIAKVIPFCKNLGYFSLLGNKIDLTAGAALIQALKSSKTLITLDCDIDNFPDVFKERIGLYTMRNMERLLYSSTTKNCSNPEEKQEVTSDSNNNSVSLTEQLSNILSMKVTHKLDLKSPEIKAFVNKASKIRQELKETINELLKLQLKNELNLEGKETLIRFLFIDSSIEKGLQLIDSSLVDQDDSKNHSSLLLTLGGEDERNKYILEHTQHELKDVASDGLVVQPPNFPPSKSPLSMSRSSSKSNLTNLDRQEGSILKLSKLHNFHHPSAENETHFLSGLSGEEIRKKLLNIDFGDLDKIIDFLGNLKERGMSLETLFNLKHKEGTNVGYSEILDIDEIKEKIKELASLNGLNDKNAPKLIHTDSEEHLIDKSQQPNHQAESKENASESQIESDQNAISEAISQAYDQVLNSLTKLQ